MRGLIYITGTIEDVFFSQEIDFFRDMFDRTAVISIEGSLEKTRAFTHEKNISFYSLSQESIVKNLVGFLRFLFGKHARDEMKKNLHGEQSVKKCMYMCLYGFSAIRAKKLYDRILNEELIGCKEIYVYSFLLSRGAFIASWNARDTDKMFKKIVARGHGYDLYEERNELQYLPFREFIFDTLDDIGLISKHGYNYFQKRYPNYKEKAKVYYLGVLNKKNLKKEPVKKNAIVIASCSSIVPLKRIDLIIQIISRLVSEGIDIRWIHMGDGILLSKMKRLAAKKLPDNRYLFLGQIDNAIILDTLMENDVDYLINMSDSEGLPVSMMEAFSVGVPVIARNVGGVSEIVGDGCGLLIDELDESSLIRIIEYVRYRLEDIEEYRKESERCIRKWDTIFNAEINHKKFIQELLLGENNG